VTCIVRFLEELKHQKVLSKLTDLNSLIKISI
jgi:hypothetical protein